MRGFFKAAALQLRIRPRKATIRKRFRLGWSQPRRRVRPVEKCRLYEQLDTTCREDAGCYTLDERTRSDLDLDFVFSTIDRTVSSTGSQYLYKTLVNPRLETEPPAGYESLVDAFATDATLREDVQMELSALDDDPSFSLPLLIWQNLPAPPLPGALVSACSFAPLALAALAVWLPWFWFAVLGMFLVNLFIHYRYEQVFGYEVATLASLGRLVRTSARLRDRLGDHIGDVADLDSAVEACLPIARKSAYLMLVDPTLLLDYVNILTLRKVAAYNALREMIASKQDQLGLLFQAVGKIDTCISIASLRASRPVWCKPVLVDTPARIQAEDLRHPALDDAVGNDLDVSGASMLVTGPNMSGKTTFLKTIAFNAVLAQTIHTCFARSYKASPFLVMTSIDVVDDIEHGKSLFAAEVDAVGRLFTTCAGRNDCLCVIDELFRGTNPAERVAAAAAVIEHLSRNNLVIFSTHDIALRTLLGPGFNPWHFAEHHQAGDIRFDYRLRPGLGQSTNAIELLRRGPIPEAVVTRALDNLQRMASAPHDESGIS